MQRSDASMAGKEAAQGRAKPKFGGNTRTPGTREAKPSTREQFLVSLRIFSRPTPELVALLSPPYKLFISGGVENPSFSSEAGKGVGGLVSAFSQRGEFPPLSNLPSYGLEISSRGGAVFCTFFDASRKVAVHSEIGSMYSGYSWQNFYECLQLALSIAEKQSREGKEFNFVSNREGTIRVN